MNDFTEVVLFVAIFSILFIIFHMIEKNEFEKTNNYETRERNESFKTLFKDLYCCCKDCYNKYYKK